MLNLSGRFFSKTTRTIVVVMVLAMVASACAAAATIGHSRIVHYDIDGKMIGYDEVETVQLRQPRGVALDLQQLRFFSDAPDTMTPPDIAEWPPRK